MKTYPSRLQGTLAALSLVAFNINAIAPSGAQVAPVAVPASLPSIAAPADLGCPAQILDSQRYLPQTRLVTEQSVSGCYPDPAHEPRPLEALPNRGECPYLEAEANQAWETRRFGWRDAEGRFNSATGCRLFAGPFPVVETTAGCGVSHNLQARGSLRWKRRVAQTPNGTVQITPCFEDPASLQPFGGDSLCPPVAVHRPGEGGESKSLRQVPQPTLDAAGQITTLCLPDIQELGVGATLKGCETAIYHDFDAGASYRAQRYWFAIGFDRVRYLTPCVADLSQAIDHSSIVVGYLHGSEGALTSRPLRQTVLDGAAQTAITEPYLDETQELTWWREASEVVDTGLFTLGCETFVARERVALYRLPDDTIHRLFLRSEEAQPLGGCAAAGAAAQ